LCSPEDDETDLEPDPRLAQIFSATIGKRVTNNKSNIFCFSIPDPRWSGTYSLCNSPQGSPRCSSLSPMRCPSPIPAMTSPFYGSCCTSRVATPSGSRGCSPSRSRPITPTTIHLNPQDVCVNTKMGYFVNNTVGVSSGAMGLPTINETTAHQGTSDIQWKAALEAERFQARKYSLTENIAYLAETGAFNRDSNNNPDSHCYYETGTYLQYPQIQGNCCCYSDLCCQVCLVLDKDTPSLTLEEMQARALNNILMQKSSSYDKCNCSSCIKTEGRRLASPVQTTPKKSQRPNDNVKKKAQTSSR